MKTYYISVSPRTGIGIGFISIGENPNHALAELSLSLRQRLIIKRAHLQEDEHSANNHFYKADIKRHLEILRTIRKPGRYCPQEDFYRGHIWEKVKIKEVTKAVTSAYVEEVWLDRNL